MDNFRERLTKNAEEFDGIVAELLGQCAAMRATFEHILEYWNKDENEDAMKDALWHIIDVASEALSSNAGRELLEYKQWYEEAMVATNEAGFVGMDAASVIRYQDEDNKVLKERLRIAEEQLRGVKAGVLVVCSAEELERLRKAEEERDKYKQEASFVEFHKDHAERNRRDWMTTEIERDQLRAELREQSELLERCKKDAGIWKSELSDFAAELGARGYIEASELAMERIKVCSAAMEANNA